MEKKGATPEELFNFIGFNRSKRAAEEGDVEEGTIYCGQIAGIINELKSVDSVIKEILEEATAVVKNLVEITTR